MLQRLLLLLPGVVLFGAMAVGCTRERTVVREEPVRHPPERVIVEHR